MNPTCPDITAAQDSHLEHPAIWQTAGSLQSPWMMPMMLQMTWPWLTMPEFDQRAKLQNLVTPKGIRTLFLLHKLVFAYSLLLYALPLTFCNLVM